MQSLARAGLSESEVRAILTASSSDVAWGVDVLDLDGERVAEVGGRIETTGPDGSPVVIDADAGALACEVEYHRTSQIKRIGSLTVLDALDWASHRVRVWQSVGGVRFDIGVFGLTTPSPTADDAITVGLTDLTQEFTDQLTDSSALLAGYPILAEVRALLAAAGVPGVQVQIDPAGDGLVAPGDRCWTLSEVPPTVIRKANDLLALAGYTSLFADESGTVRALPYRDPVEVGADWTFDATDPATVLLPGYTLDVDARRPVNCWRFLRRGKADPSEGDGIYTVDRAAGGRQRWSTVWLDAASQDALVRAGDQRVEADAGRLRQVQIKTGPLPCLGDYGVDRLIAPQIGVDAVMREINWRQSLHTLTCDIALGALVGGDDVDDGE